MSKKVFISSTYKDLQNHREAVIEMLRQTNNLAVAMETFGSKPGDPETVSMDEVRKSDLFIGIYARRYGYVHHQDRSVTEMEYEAAVDFGKPRLIFVVAEDHHDALLDAHQETDPELQVMLNRFKRRALRDNTSAIFTTPDDLRQKVQNAIMNWLQSELDLAKEAKKAADNPPSSMINSGNNNSGIFVGGSVSGNISDNTINSNKKDS